MLEVVFGRSAAGSLKQAMSGGCREIFCMEDDFSMGDISGDGLGQQRRDSLQQLFAAFPEEQRYALEALRNTAGALAALTRRARAGEPVRIWADQQPFTSCGLCWLLTQLAARVERLPPVTVMQLPGLVRRGNTLVQYRGWGEVSPEELSGLADGGQQMTPAFLAMVRMQWQELQQQNTPLRAIINGRLQSVGADFYDPFLLRELAAMPEEFIEAHLIGTVMGRDQLGIGDLWLALRVEAMIEKGLLALADPASPGEGLRRMLKKTAAL